MERCTQAITKEQYERALANGNSITAEDRKNLFSDSILYGYGLYGTEVRIDDKDGYVVDYLIGSTCD